MIGFNKNTRYPRRKGFAEPEKLPKEELSKKNRRYIGSMSLISHSAWYFYNRNRKRDNFANQSRTNYSKMVRSYFKAIKELMFEYEGGVVCEYWGYFCFMILPWARGDIEGVKSSINLSHTDGYLYNPILFSDCAKSSCLRAMAMERTFIKDVKKRLFNAVYNGFRPKLYYTLLRGMFGKNKVNHNYK